MVMLIPMMFSTKLYNKTMGTINPYTKDQLKQTHKNG